MDDKQVEAMRKEGTELWQDAGIAEKYARAELATIHFANIILDKASIPSTITKDKSPINALDLGCGTGAVVAALYERVPKEHWPSVKVLGGDISQPMLSYLQARGKKNGWTGLTTQIVDGANIQLAPSQFTHVFANAIIFFLPLGTLAKTYDLLQPGGYIGVSTWAALNWYGHLKRAVGNLPDAPPVPPFEEVRASIQQNSAWHEPAFVKQQLEDAGFKGVELTVKKEDVAIGTPAQFCESMHMPMKMFAGQWEESKREDLIKQALAELHKVMVEVAGGENEECYMEMEGIVGSGWKPAN